MSLVLQDVGQEYVIRFAKSTFCPVSIPSPIVESELMNGLRVLFVRIKVDVLIDVNLSVHRDWRRTSVRKQQNLPSETATRPSFQALAFRWFPQTQNLDDSFFRSDGTDERHG